MKWKLPETLLLSRRFCRASNIYSNVDIVCNEEGPFKNIVFWPYCVILFDISTFVDTFCVLFSATILETVWRCAELDPNWAVFFLTVACWFSFEIDYNCSRKKLTINNGRTLMHFLFVMVCLSISFCISGSVLCFGNK